MKRSIAAMTALAMLGALTAATAARAEPDVAANTEFSKRLFGSEPTKTKKAYACFVRAYDSAHLVRHPMQKVNAMKLLVTSELEPEDGTKMHSFRLGLTFKNRSGAFDSSGGCSHADLTETPEAKPSMRCSVDCDGGGISIELKDDNKAVLVKLDHIRMWKQGKPDDEGFGVSGGADDRVFRLDRAPLEMCRSLVTDRKELAELRQAKR